MEKYNKLYELLKSEKDSVETTVDKVLSMLAYSLEIQGVYTPSIKLDKIDEIKQLASEIALKDRSYKTLIEFLILKKYIKKEKLDINSIFLSVRNNNASDFFYYVLDTKVGYGAKMITCHDIGIEDGKEVIFHGICDNLNEYKVAIIVAKMVHMPSFLVHHEGKIPPEAETLDMSFWKNTCVWKEKETKELAI